ncbi:MAG: tetratricopeptide repeat protein, partial [Acidobacteriota bacterium]|nr:tetratricopeptide repeat protein [Acidobacteriota bacterium]
MAFNKAKSLKVAEKYVQQGKIAAAIEEYKKIVEADPNDLTMINTLGDLCVRAGRTEEAIFNFSKIAENYRQNGFTLKAIAMYKKISKLEPNNFDILLKLADLYAKQGLVVDAKQQYLQVAEAYKRGGQSRKAIDVLKKVADLDPADTATKLKLAESYQMEGMNAEAQEVFVAIGQELQRKSKFVEAIQALQRALSISSDSKVALKSLIDCYIQQGDTQQALSLINSALEKNPTDTDLLVLLGKTYLNAKMLAEAENAFTRLISVDNSRYDYLLEVGKKYLERGMFDKVLAISDKCVEQVLKRRTEEKVVSLLKGVLEYDSNNLKALKKLSDIYTRVREEHNLADTLKKIVDVALRTGDKDAAIDALKTLTEIEPDETAHRQRLANLGAIAAPQPSPPSTRSLPIGSKPEGIGPLIPTVAPIAAPVSPIIGTGTKPLPPPLSGDAEKKLQEARLFISRGYSAHAAGILENLLEDHPHYIEARVELKKIYEEGGEVKKAAGQALELARLYEARGDVALAQQMLQESRKLEAKSPAGAATLASGFGITGVSQAEAEESYEVEIDLSAPDTISDKSAIPVIEPEPFSSAGMNLFGGTPVSPTQPSPPVSDIFGGLPGSSSSPASGAGMNLFGGTPVSPTQPSP